MRLLLFVALLWIAVECQRTLPSNAYYDKLYDDYLARMKQYDQQVRMRKEKAMAKYHGWMEDAKKPQAVDNGVEEKSSPAPEDPFGKLPDEKVNAAKASSSTEEICRKFAPSVHLHCRGSSTDRHALRCFSYFRDCASVIPKDDPLSALAAIYATLPKPAPVSDIGVVSSTPSEGFIPETSSNLVSMSSTPAPPPLDPPRVMTAMEKKRLDMGCRRVMSTATRFCHGKHTHYKLRSSCETYLSNCAYLIPRSNPLYNLAQQALSLQVVPPPLPDNVKTRDEWEKTEAPAAVSSAAAAAAAHPTAQAVSTLTAEQIQEMEHDARAAKAALPQQSLAVLHQTCERFLPTVRKHCIGDFTKTKFANRCKAFYQDCQQFMPQSDPLYSIAHSFDSGVGLNLGSWAVAGIPYYPVNEEGAIGSSYLMNIPFGSWGGGYSQHFGVRDYWGQYQEIGANWYDGKYGYKSGWSVPLVQSLGIEGETHAAVSVPIKPGDLGKPIGVDVGGGVGPYYQQNQHVGVDWMDGQVNNNFGVGVPLAGVGVNTGIGVAFPGAGTWLG